MIVFTICHRVSRSVTCGAVFEDPPPADETIGRVRKLGPRLQRSFFERAVDDVAQDLLGRVITVDRDGIRVAVRLTEVEAYAGLDRSGVARLPGRTPRTSIMFGPAGHLYTYFVYGMHWCANIVTGTTASASAVLLRAGEVVDGVDTARSRRPRVKHDKDLARGPAGLATVLGLRRATNGADLCRPDGAIALFTGRAAPAQLDPALVRGWGRCSSGGAAALLDRRRADCVGLPGMDAAQAHGRARRGAADSGSRSRWKDDGVPNSDVELSDEKSPALVAEPGATMMRRLHVRCLRYWRT